MSTPLTEDHIGRGILVRCMDFRQTLHGMLREFVDGELGGARCDTVSVAGAVRKLAEDDGADAILESIGIGLKAHRAGIVILLNHTDCGYYALKGVRFTSSEEEQRILIEDLRRARSNILTAFPNNTPKVVMYLAVLSNTDGTIEFRQVDAS